MERFNFDDRRLGRLLDSFPGEEEPDPSGVDTDAGLPRLIIHQLDIERAGLAWTDRTTDPDFSTELGPISVSIANLNTLPDNSGDQRVQVVSRNGGSFSWEGSLQVNPLMSRGRFSIQGPALDDLHEYLATLMPLKTSGGDVDIRFDYQLSGPPPGSTGIDEDYRLTVENLQARFDDLSVRRSGRESAEISLSAAVLSNARLNYPEATMAADSFELTGLAVESWLDSEGEFSLLQL